MLKKGQLHHHFFLLAYPKFAQDQLSNFGAFPLPSSLNSKSCQFSMQLVTGADSRKKGNGILETGFSNKKECCLVVYLPYPSEKYEFVNGKDDIPYIYIYTPYIMEKKCSKPPTRWIWVSFAMINQNHLDFEGGFWPIVTFQGRNFNEVSARLEKTWSIAVLSVHLPGMLDNSDAPRYVLVRGFSGQLHPSLAVAPEFPWRSYFLHVFCQNTLKYVWLCTSQIFKHTILPLTIYGDVVMRLTP